jgi:hypothetical protein
MTPINTLFRHVFILIVGLLFIATPRHAFAQGGCGAEAGSVNMDAGPLCLHDGEAMLTGIPSANAVVPAGYTSTYLLTRTNGRIIEQMGPSPTFLVSGTDGWRIHRLVFDPATLDLASVVFGVTSAYDVRAQLLEGGGTICGSLSMSGPFVKTMECEESCEAFASGMIMDSTLVCLTGGQATLTAVPAGASNVPIGFEQVFVLSRTNGLIIAQLSPTPSFTVNSTNVWRIHNLVYDPATLDLSAIVLGSTTAYDIWLMFQQGGGTICGNLDLNGAPVKTGECGTPCFAEAGEVSADQADLCLIEGTAQLSATPDGGATLPDGYVINFLLAQGTDTPMILDHGNAPMFTVAAPGIYGIHPFVYDPGTFDITTVVPGETTLMDLNAQLLQGGGGICASLDLDGADFQVVDCSPPCVADAGSMGAENEISCLVEGSTAISAHSNGDTLVPPGFVMSYFLSQGAGLVLLDLNSSPVFTVTDTGLYHIHAFVYDPATWNTGMLTFGTSTALDLNAMLTQGGGSICANLDFMGASITVTICPPPCTGGSDTTVSVCSSDGAFPLFALLEGDPCPGGSWTTPDGSVSSGIFVPGLDPSGVYTYTVGNGSGATSVTMVTVNVVAASNAGSSAFITLCSNGSTYDLFDALAGTPESGGVWTGPNTLVNGQFDPTTMTGGAYTYTVSGTGPCPDATANVMVMVTSAPNAGTDGMVDVCLTDPPIQLLSELNGDPDAGGTWSGPSPVVNGVFVPGSMMAGTYAYTVAGSPPCAPDTAFLTVNVLECPNVNLTTLTSGKDGSGNADITTAVEDLEAGSYFTIWPNPAIGTVHMALPSTGWGDVHVELIDATGRIVEAKPLQRSASDLTLDVSTLTPGVWTVRIISGGTLGIGRFVR